jgi:hypothetical protein
MKIISTKIYWYNFHIFKHDDFKIIHHVYYQCLTQTLFKTTYFTKPEGVLRNMKNFATTSTPQSFKNVSTRMVVAIASILA